MMSNFLKAIWNFFDQPTKVYANGVKEWRDGKGQLNRPFGPAIIRPNGSETWMKHGKIHRKNGPAVINTDGTTDWYIDGVFQFTKGATK